MAVAFMALGPSIFPKSWIRATMYRWLGDAWKMRPAKEMHLNQGIMPWIK